MRWLVLVVLVAVPAQADVLEGREAFVRGDYATALRELQPAAESGDREAQFHLGFMRAEGLGVEQDDQLAADWYRKAADQGHPRAQYNLGFFYEHGTAVKQDNAEAVKLYELAAEQGSVKAQYRVAALYEEGAGVERDLILAFKWFALAGRDKFADARKRKGKVAKRMTPKEISLAELEVRLWKARQKEEKKAGKKP